MKDETYCLRMVAREGVAARRDGSKDLLGCVGLGVGVLAWVAWSVRRTLRRTLRRTGIQPAVRSNGNGGLLGLHKLRVEG